MPNTPITFVENGQTISGAKNWPGGRGTFSAIGAFDNATMTLRWRRPGWASWIDLVALTANGVQNFEIGGVELDLSISGGSPTNHNVVAVPF